MSTSDGGFPVHRHERDYLSGPNVSTAIFLCLTSIIQLFSPKKCTREGANKLLFWKQSRPHPAGLEVIYLVDLMSFRESNRLGQPGHGAAQILNFRSFCRDADHHVACFNILRHHGSGSHHGVVANAASGQHRAVVSETNAITDASGKIVNPGNFVELVGVGVNFT